MTSYELVADTHSCATQTFNPRNAEHCVIRLLFGAMLSRKRAQCWIMKFISQVNTYSCSYAHCGGMWEDRGVALIALNLGNRWGEWSASLPGRLNPKELSLVIRRDERFQRVLHYSIIKILYMHKVNFPITFVVFVLRVHNLDTTTGQDSINSDIFIVLCKFWIMKLQ